MDAPAPCQLSGVSRRFGGTLALERDLEITSAGLERRSWPSQEGMGMWQLYLLEARYVLVKLARLPAYAVPTLAFPLVFYLLFGIAMSGTRAAGGPAIAGYLLATYGALGVIGAGLFAFGVGVAVERAQGWLLLKRASPMSLWTYLFGKVAASMAFSGAIFGLLALGYAAGPNSAPAIVNLVHLPASLTAGLWMPIFMLPRFMQAVAPWLPQYHLGQLALATTGAGRDTNVPLHLMSLALWTALGIGAAAWAYRRDEGKQYG